jgi:hypothetical protein
MAIMTDDFCGLHQSSVEYIMTIPSYLPYVHLVKCYVTFEVKDFLSELMWVIAQDAT